MSIKFDREFYHVTADALETFKVIGSKVKVTASKLRQNFALFAPVKIRGGVGELSE